MGDEKKPYAAFTRCWDERYHMWLWLQHYAPEVGEDNCYVFWAPVEGDQQDEMSHAYPGVHWIEDDHPDNIRSDEVWDMNRMKTFNDKLLETHEVVIMTDADELLVPGNGEPLAAWLDVFRKGDRRYAMAHGYHVFENMDRRGSHFRWYTPSYCKTSITKVPLSYRIGFHQAWDAPQRGNNLNCTQHVKGPDIDLAHMPFANFDEYVAKCERRAAIADKICEGAGLRFDGRDPKLSEEFFRTGVPPWSPGNATFARMRDHTREQVPEHWVELSIVQ